jgi:hypothetical protein
LIPVFVGHHASVLHRYRPIRAAAALLAAALFLPSGCAKRIPAFSPRLDNTAEHREARKAADCLACHAVGEIPSDHSAGDDCIRCHKYIPGVSR